MAFIPIDPSLIEVGDPVTADLASQIKNNLDSHEARLLDVEGAINKIEVFNLLFINAIHTIQSGLTEISLFRANADFVLTEAKVVVLEAGTSGTLEIDLLKSSTIGGTFTSVFSTKPSLTSGAGSNVESTNAVFSTTNVANGDYLKLNVDSFQVAQKRFFVHIFGEAS